MRPGRVPSSPSKRTFAWAWAWALPPEGPGHPGTRLGLGSPPEGPAHPGTRSWRGCGAGCAAAKGAPRRRGGGAAGGEERAAPRPSLPPARLAAKLAAWRRRGGGVAAKQAAKHVAKMAAKRCGIARRRSWRHSGRPVQVSQFSSACLSPGTLLIGNVGTVAAEWWHGAIFCTGGKARRHGRTADRGEAAAKRQHCGRAWRQSLAPKLRQGGKASGHGGIAAKLAAKLAVWHIGMPAYINM
eukprot:gene312-biopygen437